MKIDEIKQVLQQTSADVWKNFKSHSEQFDINNPTKFWDDWQDDIDVMDEAYRDDPVRYIAFQHMVKGFQLAVAWGLKYEKRND